MEILLDTLPDTQLTYTYNDTNNTATVTGFTQKHSVVYMPKTNSDLF